MFPVLERHCSGCHDKAATVGPRSKPCFKDPPAAYATLHPYIHRPGMESDMALLQPMEYHASTSPLIQMLEKGHHGVRLAGLDREARERFSGCRRHPRRPAALDRPGAWPPAVLHADSRRRVRHGQPRRACQPWQKVYDVGFRVIVEESREW